MLESIRVLVDRFAEGRVSRRELVAGLALISAGACRLAAARRGGGAPSEQPPPDPIPVRGWSHAALRVTDVARSRDFYREHFGMRLTRESDRSAFLTMGGPFLALFAPGAGRSKESGPGLDHLAFSVEGWNFDALVSTLRKRGLEPWTEEDRIYFRDPDGIILQVSP